MKRFFSAGALAVLLAVATGAWAQVQVNFGYGNGARTGLWGTGKTELYNVAVCIDNPMLEGLTLTELKVPVNGQANHVSGYEVFLASSLALKEGKAVADIASQPFTPEGDWTTVVLDKPYKVGSGPFYVGLTCRVDQLDESNKKPLRVAYASHRNGLMVATSRTYRSWRDMTESNGYVWPVVLVLDGDIRPNAAAPMAVRDVRLKRGESGKVKATLVNVGTLPVTDMDYVFEVDGEKATGHVDLAEPLPADVFAAETVVEVQVPAVGSLGNHEGRLVVTKVNGVENGRQEAEASGRVRVLDFLPVHRAVMEEFTGTWCVWCPRGWVAMEKMKECYPDRYIALSYHVDDIMEITRELPVGVSGFPSATIDRGEEVDPYMGSSGTVFGIEQDWLQRCEEPAPADIKVEAFSDKEQTRVHVRASVRFAEEADGHPYSMAYFVTADGLTGEGNDWMQANAYSGMFNSGSDFEFFANSPSTVTLEYHDVVIAKTDYAGVEGSIPSVVSPDEEVVHTCDFSLADMQSQYREGVSLVQDIGKLNVVAVLVNRTTGRIENGMKCRVQAGAISIGAARTEEPAVPVACYSPDGVRVGEGYKGWTLVQMSDGSVRKEFRR